MRLIRIAIYLRVSSDGQVNDSNGIRIEDGSLETQHERAMEHIINTCRNLGHEYQIVSIIEDPAKSAKDTNRKGFQRLFELVEHKRVDWVVTSELSRLNRDTLDYLLFKKHCIKHSVEIIYVGSIFKERDHATDMIETILASYAEYERKQTSTRLKNNITSRLKTNGKINGAVAILGLDKCPRRKGHFVINVQEVSSLLELFNIYLTSSSQAETLEKAKNNGIRDKDGKELSKLRFKNILMNVEWRYRGQWYLQEKGVDEKLIINLDHGPLIDEEFSKRIVEKRELFSSKKIRCGINNHIYLLSSVLKDKSDDTFSGQIGHGRSKDYRYYYNKISKQRLNASIVEDKIEKRIIQYFKNSKLFQSLIASGFKDRDANVINLKKDISKYRVEVDKVSKQVNILVENMTRSGLNAQALQTITNKINDLEIDKEKIVEQIRFKEEEIQSFQAIQKLTNAQLRIEQYAKNFQNLSRIQKRELIEAIFEKIEVIDIYSLKLHIKKAPFSGAFLTSQLNGYDSCSNGGSNWT